MDEVHDGFCNSNLSCGGKPKRKWERDPGSYDPMAVRMGTQNLHHRGHRGHGVSLLIAGASLPPLLHPAILLTYVNASGECAEFFGVARQAEQVRSDEPRE